ncbi:MAG: lysylphosphatidylglycerol synthase transmembrane domain-containing protein [Eubacteriaceae bacterium]|jgi:uncharacterized protein (TIRG00374 family)
MGSKQKQDNDKSERLKRFFKKYGSWLLFAFVIGATIWVIMTNVDLKQFWHSLNSANPLYLILAVIVVMFYWLCEAWMDWSLIRIRRPEKKFSFAFNVMVTGQYYNMLSPSSTAGQPLMIVRMVRSGMQPGDATAVVTQKYVVYQIAVTFYALLGILFEWKSFLHWGSLAWLGAIFGLIFNIGAAGVILFTMIHPESAEKVILWGCRLLEKIHILKNRDQYTQQINEFIGNYKDVILLSRNNKKKTLKVMAAQIVSIGIYYSVIFWIYKALGLSGTSPFTIIMIHGILYVSYTFLPVSGGAGGAEIMFALMYKSIFGAVDTSVALLIWRCFTFYLVLLFGGIWLALQSFKAGRSSRAAG